MAMVQNNPIGPNGIPIYPVCPFCRKLVAGINNIPSPGDDHDPPRIFIVTFRTGCCNTLLNAQVVPASMVSVVPVAKEIETGKPATPSRPATPAVVVGGKKLGG